MLSFLSVLLIAGVNLKGSDLEGSNLGNVNLRVATLKGANLQNCNLRGAELAGADLEVRFFIVHVREFEIYAGRSLQRERYQKWIVFAFSRSFNFYDELKYPGS